MPCELKALSLLATNISFDLSGKSDASPQAMQTAALVTSSTAHKF